MTSGAVLPQMFQFPSNAMCSLPSGYASEGNGPSSMYVFQGMLYNTRPTAPGAPVFPQHVANERDPRPPMPMPLNQYNGAAVQTQFVSTAPATTQSSPSVNCFDATDFEPKSISEMLGVPGTVPRVSPTPSSSAPLTSTQNHIAMPSPPQGSLKSSNKRTFPETETSGKFNRRERNREHAKRSRLRKKSFTQSLQQSLKDLKDENEKLQKLVFDKLGEDEGTLLVQERIRSPSEQFIAALKKPINRNLDDDTLSFLKNLQKKIPTNESAESLAVVG